MRIPFLPFYFDAQLPEDSGGTEESSASDEKFMRRALNEAREAYDEDEVPIGAIIVIKNKIIARGYNQTEKLNDCTAHAEMLALTAAFNYMGSKYLPEATIFVTLEPCLMCAGALYWSKIGRVVYGAKDEKNGFRKTTEHRSPFHPHTKVENGLLEDECKQLMKNFFKEKRKLKS